MKILNQFLKNLKKDKMNKKNNKHKSLKFNNLSNQVKYKIWTKKYKKQSKIKF